MCNPTLWLLLRGFLEVRAAPRGARGTCVTLPYGASARLSEGARGPQGARGRSGPVPACALGTARCTGMPTRIAVCLAGGRGLML
jgi:hypothetical protein